MGELGVRRRTHDDQSVSCDINFWKQERPLGRPPVEIYRALCSGEPVTGLANLPVDQVLQRLKQVFPAFDRTKQFPFVRTPIGSLRGVAADAGKPPRLFLVAFGPGAVALCVSSDGSERALAANSVPVKLET